MWIDPNPSRAPSWPPKPRFASEPASFIKAEACERTFDPRLGCWVKAQPSPPAREERLPLVTPISDGSGVRWTVFDNAGQPMWTFEAWDFDTALVEKRRLCAGSGYRSGWAHLRLAR